MSPRFHIEEMVHQDAAGVVFRATDSGTGAPVAVRRFFPFGPDGGGLSTDEREAYAGVISQLRGFHHRGLRATLDGGCDPVDGIPFVITEWLPGTTLEEFHGPLAEDAAVAVLDRAMDICEQLSAGFGHDEVWVDTALRAIVVTDEAGGRGVTFWISPLKCLGKLSGGRGLEPLILLAENLTGWHGRAYHAGHVHGLAAWILWLRGASQTANLREAREKLAKCRQATPAPPPPARPAAAVPKKKKRRVLPAVLAAAVALGGIAGAGWWLMQRDAARRLGARGALAEIPAPPPVQPAAAAIQPVSLPAPAAAAVPARLPALAGETPEDRVNRLAIELSRDARKASEDAKARDAARQAEIDRRGGVFSPADRDLLLAQAKKQVALEGVLADIAPSSSGKTLYLIFSTSPAAPRASIATRDAPPDLAAPALAPLKGKKVRIQGTVAIEAVPKPGRPVIRISDRNAITVVE